jgi:hypothetical protein
MNTRSMLLLWGPRVLGLLVCVFIGLFALDALDGPAPAGRRAAEFAIHLVPSALLLVAVALSWRWPAIGGFVFIALALLYALVANERLDWIAAISGPLALVGLAFLWSWRHLASPSPS